VWWHHDLAEQPSLWENWVELGDEFFKAITAHPIPVDMNALQHLKGSALALDLYAWLTHEAFRSATRNKSRRVAWRSLHEQFGADYNDVRNFSRKALEALGKIKVVFPGLEVEPFKGGITIKPGEPAIASKVIAVPEVPKLVALPSSTKKPKSEAVTTLPKLSASVREKAVILAQGSAWDVHDIERQFYDYIRVKGTPKYLDRAFLGFVRKKLKSSP
jgi:hypothetical protein